MSYSAKQRCLQEPAGAMVAKDTAGSGDGLDGEKEMDPKEPTSEELLRREDGDIEMAASVSDSVSPSVGLPDDQNETRKWSWSVIFLCFYGFMMSIKPGEPFITPYLLSPEKNFTREQVNVPC